MQGLTAFVPVEQVDEYERRHRVPAVRPSTGLGNTGRRRRSGVRTMEFLQCRDCGFVLRGSPDGAEPMHWSRCPDCGGTQFEGIEK